MDINNLTQNLITGIVQKNTEQFLTLSRLLNIALGKVVIASVIDVASVTPQERDALLTQTLEALLQSNKLANNAALLTPALKAEISRLLDQQALIKSPELKWINLLVNNQPVLTYSNKPFTAGQTVMVQLVTPQKLVFLDLDNLNHTETISGPALNKVANSTYTTQSTANSNLATKTTGPQLPVNLQQPESTSAITTTANTLNGMARYQNISGDQHAKHIIAESLRQLLPIKDAPSILFSALAQWQNIPKEKEQQLVSPSLAQALKSAAEKIRAPLQLTQPKALAQIIKNSGIFFENTLATHLNTTNKSALNQTYSQDLKGSLLNLLNKVNQELTGNNKPLSTEQTVQLLQQVSRYIPNTGTPSGQTVDATKNSLPIDINVLIQQLMMKPVKELSDKELRTQLLVLLQQHSVHSLAKVQLQQLASLNNEIANKDSSQPNASWQIEIPVKHHHYVQHLNLHIEREWVDDKNSTPETKSATRIKQWSVTLRFDLPTLGEFCAQLAIVDTSISATLWATREKTLAQVRQHIDSLRKQLESEGIHVKQIQCIKGMPPQKSLALSYSLIDVST